jgi:hypothetical protein
MSSYLSPSALSAALNLRDLTDPSQGSHAMRALLDAFPTSAASVLRLATVGWFSSRRSKTRRRVPQSETPLPVLARARPRIGDGLEAISRQRRALAHFGLPAPHWTAPSDGSPRRGAQRSEDTRREAGRSPALGLDESDSAACSLSATVWSAASCSERRDLTTEVCYRLGADGSLRRRAGVWYTCCLSSLGLGAVGAACRSSGLASVGG